MADQKVERAEREGRRVKDDDSLNTLIVEMGLPDKATNVDELPWVPQGERSWLKPLRFDLVNGRWIKLLKVEGCGKIKRHRHSGWQVLGYSTKGS